MSRATTAIAVGVVAATGLGVAVVVSAGASGLAAEIYLFVVALLALAAIVLRVVTALPAVEPAPPQPPLRQNRLGQLESVARLLERAEMSSFDLHDRLRPIVREIATARLARRGVTLDRQPGRARALLGERVWDLVRPDREAPAGRFDRGFSREELREIVDALEAI